VGNFDAAENQFASRDELMNIVSDADVNHARRLGEAEQGRKDIKPERCERGQIWGRRPELP
jgi:hypothetical protein